jgi:DNA-binding XRE family transcriptional regulator
MPEGPPSSWSVALTTKKLVKGNVLTRDTLLPVQCRMARVALQWSVNEAGRAAGVSYRTIVRLESEQREIQAGKVAAIRRGFEAAGVRFVDEGPDAGAVVPPLKTLPPG